MTGVPVPSSAGSPVPSAADSPVPPGTGWPGDPASATTVVAHDAAGVRTLAAAAGSLSELEARQSVCRACPRLVQWREDVARTKRASSRAERYWGRPVPGWGDDHPRVLVMGLAPAAHGGNRTGRVFTGDRSGDVLFASLHRCGLAAAPTSVTAGDGQRLISARVVAAVRCAPPANKPSVAERDTCAPWLAAEFAFVAPDVRAVVCLGAFAWQSAWRMLGSAGHVLPRPRPRFGHGAEVVLGRMLLLGCYHPSQQNTFTGRVTPAMLDDVFGRAVEWAGTGSGAAE
ncbi:MAG TPA: uracil-DNA glycosylase [Streptosporangiaceae bacterium]|nr:uracil-DNA glycosylase [Streptosporangiaceae bacterium]